MTPMKIDVSGAVALIGQQSEFLILSHEHPDGDTLGCAFALMQALKILGKKRAFRCADEVPKDFSFMTAGVQSDEVKTPFIIAVDVADLKLLGESAAEYEEKIDLCIDHHMSNTLFAKKTLFEPKAAASETVLELIRALGVPIDSVIATCIYTGVSTDTGCFRYQNTTPQSLRTAAEMMEKGADTVLINKLMFETKTKTFLALELLARNTLEYHFDGRCALLTITQEMYRKSGSNEHECYPITALPRQIEGVLVGAVIKEKKNGSFGISVRTDGGVDASAICALLGGGGHKGAAGCDVALDYDFAKKKFLDAVAAVLKKGVQ